MPSAQPSQRRVDLLAQAEPAQLRLGHEEAHLDLARRQEADHDAAGIDPLAGVAQPVVDHGRHGRPHRPLVELPLRLGQGGLAHRHLGPGGGDLVVAPRQPGGGELGLHGRDAGARLLGRGAGLVEARLGGEVARGRALPAAPGPARHRSAPPWPRRGWPRSGRSPPAACRACRSASSGSGARELRLGLADHGPLPACLEREQERAGLDPVAALHGDALQPAGGGRAEADILALGVAVQPAARRRRRSAATSRQTPISASSRLMARSPRSSVSTWASSTRAGSNGSASCGANTARQMAIISTGATTSRATASLSCGRNSPAATPWRCRRAIRARARSATFAL